MACVFLEGESCKFAEFGKQVRLAWTAKLIGDSPLIEEYEQPIKDRLSLEYLEFYDLVMLRAMVDNRNTFPKM